MDKAPLGWLKINTDAAFKDGKAFLGFVVRDDCGSLFWSSSNVVKCHTAHHAEMSAIMWALEFAAHMDWNNIVWSSDAFEAVRNVTSPSTPKGWHCRYDSFRIESSFACFYWKISWNPQSSIFLANTFAKDPQAKNFSFSFDSANCSCLPPFIAYLIRSDL